MLKNTYFLAKIGADTAENEQHFAEILPKTGNYPTGRVVVVHNVCLSTALPVEVALVHLLFPPEALRPARLAVQNLPRG